jgi:hypothetical protein
MTTQKAKTAKHLTKAKKLEAAKPLKAAGAPNLFNATCNGVHISKGTVTYFALRGNQ